MMNTSVGVCVSVALLVGGAVQASAANIVTDPGFESGTPGSYTGAMGDGWFVTVGTGAICNVSGAGCGNAGPAHTGTQMAFLDWSNSFNTTTQTLTTVPGQTYAISYWVNDGRANLLQVMFGGSTLFNGTSPDNNTYTLFILSSTATSTSTLLGFSGQRTTGMGGTLLDDVSVTPVLGNFQGGPSSSPVFLVGSSVGGITGTIGNFGSQEYYSFLWDGGAFSASASIAGANANASYLFSEGVVGSCSGGGSQTLNGGNNFTGTIAISSLPAGQYCIGISANDVNDPAFTLVFNTPVSGVPEPSTLVLLTAGLGTFVLRRLRQ